MTSTNTLLATLQFDCLAFAPRTLMQCRPPEPCTTEEGTSEANQHTTLAPTCWCWMTSRLVQIGNETEKDCVGDARARVHTGTRKICVWQLWLMEQWTNWKRVSFNLAMLAVALTSGQGVQHWTNGI